MKERKLYLSYEQSERGGQICKGQEGQSYPDREPTYVEFTPLGVYTKRGDWNETLKIDFLEEGAVVEGTPVYLVIVRYTTGDTFGYTTGQWNIPLTTLDQDKADRICESIKDNSYPGYKPWDGYFERLESCEIWCTNVKDEKNPGVRYF